MRVIWLLRDSTGLNISSCGTEGDSTFESLERGGRAEDSVGTVSGVCGSLFVLAGRHQFVERGDGLQQCLGLSVDGLNLILVDRMTIYITN